MTQLQISIEFHNGKIRVQLNQLRREDASKEELAVAEHMGNVFLETFKGAARDAGLNVKEKKVKGA
jgi:hypothetical protein